MILIPVHLFITLFWNLLITGYRLSAAAVSHLILLWTSNDIEVNSLYHGEVARISSVESVYIMTPPPRQL